MGAGRSTLVAFPVLLAATLAAATCMALAGGKAKAKPFADWYRGAAGYRDALARQETESKPLLVYFRAPWCPFCAKIDKKVLTDPAVAEEVAGMIGVRIYGEEGDDEKRLMAEFGAEGYPAIFVRPGPRSEFRRIDVFDEKGKIVPPGRFLEALREARPAPGPGS